MVLEARFSPQEPLKVKLSTKFQGVDFSISENSSASNVLKRWLVIWPRSQKSDEYLLFFQDLNYPTDKFDHMGEYQLKNLNNLLADPLVYRDNQYTSAFTGTVAQTPDQPWMEDKWVFTY